MLRTYLAAKSVQVEIADTAEAGLALLWRLAASGMTVDAIVIDLKLPGMDAFEFGHALDAEADLRALRTILLTAYDEAGQRGRALAAGFTAYLTKPVRQATLFRVLANACGRGAAVPEATAPDPGAAEIAPPSRESALAAECPAACWGRELIWLWRNQCTRRARGGARADTT